MLSNIKGKQLKKLTADLGIPGRSKLKADELRQAAQDLVLGVPMVFSQVHPGLQAGDVVRNEVGEPLGFLLYDDDGGWRMQVVHAEFAEQARVIGSGQGSTQELPLGSVVSTVVDGTLRHYYKRSMPDTWVLAESDGVPVQGGEAEDWLEDETRPPVSMHGVYILGVGLCWPEGVPVRSTEDPRSLTTEDSQGTPTPPSQEGHLTASEKPRHTSTGTPFGEPRLKGRLLTEYRKLRKRKRKQRKKQIKQQRKRKQRK